MYEADGVRPGVLIEGEGGRGGLYVCMCVMFGTVSADGYSKMLLKRRRKRKFR